MAAGAATNITWLKGNEKGTKHGIEKVHTYFIEQHKHDTTRVACNTITTTTMLCTTPEVVS